jgi:hypothetical protein
MKLVDEQCYVAARSFSSGGILANTNRLRPVFEFPPTPSQSIIGTKQLKVEETDSGSPFFIHTRNCAGCSPSLVQEVGFRIRSLDGLWRPYVIASVA